MAEIKVELRGADQLRDALLQLPDQLRRRVLRKAVRSAGNAIAKAARSMAKPDLKKATKYRKPGTVRRAISVRTSKVDRRSGDVGVFVNVRPIGRSVARVAKLGKMSAKNPNDPFYWRFLEFGTKKMSKRPFLKPAAERVGEAAIDQVVRVAAAEIEKL